MREFWEFKVWPWLKTRSMLWWWIIKYRGKKNIPGEVILEQITKTMARLHENLNAAIDIGPDSEEERLLAREALLKSIELGREFDNLKLKKKK